MKAGIFQSCDIAAAVYRGDARVDRKDRDIIHRVDGDHKCLGHTRCIRSTIICQHDLNRGRSVDVLSGREGQRSCDRINRGCDCKECGCRPVAGFRLHSDRCREHLRRLVGRSGRLTGHEVENRDQACVFINRGRTHQRIEEWSVVYRNHVNRNDIRVLGRRTAEFTKVVRQNRYAGGTEIVRDRYELQPVQSRIQILQLAGECHRDVRGSVAGKRCKRKAGRDASQRQHSICRRQHHR